MSVRTYSSPEAFKQALEQRLRASAKTGGEFARKRQLLVFDRFLARGVAVFGDAVILKGGLVLELRLERARTTKNVDLRLTGTPKTVLARLQQAARSDQGDFMVFEVGPDEDHPEIQNDGMKYEGIRFSASLKSRSRRTPSALPASLRRRCGCIRAVTAAARAFLDPVLAGGLVATWDSRRWRWRASRAR